MIVMALPPFKWIPTKLLNQQESNERLKKDQEEIRARQEATERRIKFVEARIGAIRQESTEQSS